MKVKWVTADSADGERTLKQHAVFAAIRDREWTREEYPGNRALCNHSAGITNENEEFEDFDKIDGEPQKEKCCAVCARIAKKLTPTE